MRAAAIAAAAVSYHRERCTHGHLELSLFLQQISRRKLLPTVPPSAAARAQLPVSKSAVELRPRRTRGARSAPATTHATTVSQNARKESTALLAHTAVDVNARLACTRKT
jgi:hypothetical protein